MLFTTTRTNGGKTRSKIHVGKMIVGGKMRSCAKKQRVSCCMPKIGLGCVFFPFLLFGLKLMKTIFPPSSLYFDWSFEAWRRRLGEDGLLLSTPDCLPSRWRCITGRRWLAAPSQKKFKYRVKKKMDRDRICSKNYRDVVRLAPGPSLNSGC